MLQSRKKSFLDEFKYFTPYTIDIFNHSHPDKIRGYLNKFRLTFGKTKDLIFDFSTAEFIQDKLAPSFNLNQEHTKEVTRIIGDILLTNTFVGDMVGEIQAKLALRQDTAKQIASMIVTDLFLPAIDEIKDAHKKKFEDRIRSMQSLEEQSEPKKEDPDRVFSNPDVSLDINNHNILDLRK